MKTGKILYNHLLRDYAREFRKNQTKAEKTLWAHIRKQQLGTRFNRQVPIDKFIVDFYSFPLRLALKLMAKFTIIKCSMTLSGKPF